MTRLEDAELERYARQLILRELGGAGQRKLKQARVALVGMGGLGCPAALYLAAAGVGQLTLIDDDIVSLDNLQRQILYTTADIGQPKVTAAAARLAALNPHVDLVPVQARLDADTAPALLDGQDLVLDGSDSFSTRLAVNRAAIAAGVPLVAGSIGAFDGQLGVFKGHAPPLPCYQCLVGPAVDRPGTSCADVGVLGPTAGIIGSLMALEALRELAAFGDSQAGTLMIFDGLAGRQRRVRLPRDPGCAACGHHSAAIAS
ncbi:HesA/MoeB/ThiF family protein [Polymorphobacter sp.]|uniref:HesA/MoeB/ThiF family protein n=1 Tax=Polymorphobacter sp. TaxID=1909290 RepID=UPI003F72FE85